MMKFNLTSLKIISLATLTIVIVAPTKIAEAAATSTTNEVSEKVEIVKGQKSTRENQGAGEHSGSASGIPKFLLTKKAHQIEFFTYLSLIGFSIIIPEIFYKPKKNSQSTKYSENNQNKSEQKNDIDLDYLDSKFNQDKKNPFSNPYSVATNNSENNKEFDVGSAS